MTVLSFHPIFEADRNLLCAGREPCDSDLAAIRDARAVVLPQGCSSALYNMARENCAFVFPDYEARFRYPGKIGQSRLFRQCKAPHPETQAFTAVDELFRHYGPSGHRLPQPLPFVFKFDWGGEGDTVFLVESAVDFEKKIRMARDYERTGQGGFLIQELISSDNRVLRVVVVGRRQISYWRTNEHKGPFAVNLAGGAAIDRHADPHLITAAERAIRQFCRQTGINLAGFDVLFPTDNPDPTPLFLEINYWFGRRGLGGSEAYYQLLTREILAWLKEVGVAGRPL